jgi:hypothetical protein
MAFVLKSSPTVRQRKYIYYLYIFLIIADGLMTVVRFHRAPPFCRHQCQLSGYLQLINSSTHKAIYLPLLYNNTVLPITKAGGVKGNDIHVETYSKLRDSVNS